MTVPTASGPWWRDDGDPTHPVRITADLFWRRDYEKFVQPVTDDGHWLAPVLTPTEAAALTARAERAERERDELRAAVAAYADYLAKPATFTGTPSEPSRMLVGPRVRIADDLRDILTGSNHD